ncbi:MAG TPA: hypothetical protein PLI18_08775, partial [Pirellulaceae bacterium]|nr:hypothetical protein [Pirellulaceae bacterium]
TLVVTLRSTYNKEMCERPERRVRLEEAVQAVTGQRVRIDFQTLPTPSRPQQFGSTQAQRRQFLRDVQQHPWIAEAMELFDGEVIDARPPRRAPGS